MTCGVCHAELTPTLGHATRDAQLLCAAKKAFSYFKRHAEGDYIGPTEDLSLGRELFDAIQAVEESAVYAASQTDPRRS